ncbi:MAG TPA: YggS family pyridoxal phosphate-dependent enzyme [Quisquiliibacterium sp.]|nr:YggS family pyridoxal phosphate-dependent enzyme [Quisquiliibacterium sp.]HQN14441.1 YggS family pyridoxal phosphate-dependent enzyme [Quisquiliibacterium sp.]
MNGDPTLQQRYETVLARIRAACGAAARAPDAVSLLAVSKTFDASAVLALAALGQRAFAESYLQEALDKISRCASERPDPALEWHFIGPIQSNKTRPIAETFSWVHSVERDKIARRLSEQRPASLPPLNVCVQVNVSGEASKSGCAPDEALDLARAVAALPGLRLRGVMAIPEPTDDVARQRAQFAAVRAVFDRVRAAGLDVDTLSMGMSDDLEAAIAEGSTCVRVGTALFGRRG